MAVACKKTNSLFDKLTPYLHFSGPLAFAIFCCPLSFSCDAPYPACYCHSD
jgi:hypothetical protein